MKTIKFLIATCLLLAAQVGAQTVPDGVCTIADTLWNNDGTPQVGGRVVVSRVEKNNVLISLGPRTYTSNASGIVSFTLPQGCTAWIYANINGFNTPPSGSQVAIPDSAGTCTYQLDQLQPASTTVSTNAGFVVWREIDGSPSYEISGNDDTLEVSNSILSNPATRRYRLAIPTSLSGLSDINITGASAGNILMRRASGIWVDTTASALATNWNDIGDATGDGTIALAGFETDFTSTIDAAGKAVLTITNTDADAANDNSFLDLRHNDGGDPNVFYIRMVSDNDGTPTDDFLFSQSGATFTLDLTVPTEVYDATNWNGSNEVPTKDAVRDKIESLTPAGGFAPADADYLVGTVNGTLSAEIVVGTTPGGELGGTWASPTIDAEAIALNELSDVDIAGAGTGDILMRRASGVWVDTTATTGAPADADYLVGTTNGSLSAEIVVGTTPGGELGGTWGSPTIDADAVLWNEIGDAGADATIAMAGNETDFTSTIDAANKAVLTITNTDADAANDNSLIDLRHDDGADANVFYLRMVGDNDGTPTNDYLFAQTGATFTLDLTVPTEAYDATGWNSDNTVPTKDAVRDKIETLVGDVKSFTIIDTVKSTDGFGLWKTPYAITITEIAGFTNTGTCTFNVEQRAETTPNTSGTDVLTADLVADNDQQESTSFNDATVPVNTWLYFSASAAASGPQKLTVTIRYTID